MLKKFVSIYLKDILLPNNGTLSVTNYQQDAGNVSECLSRVRAAVFSSLLFSLLTHLDISFFLTTKGREFQACFNHVCLFHWFFH